jgi:hypothetical protein
MKPCSGIPVPGLCADNAAVGALSARDKVVQQVLADLGRLAAARVAAYQNHRVLVDVLQDGRLHKEGGPPLPLIRLSATLIGIKTTSNFYK